MEFEILGWPDEDVPLDLDHERFAYAGKFVMSRTGKAVVREGDELLGAVAFDADRTDESVCRLRYVTVRADRRGEGIGSRLLAFVRARVVGAGGFETVEIAVNNPFAYDAAYRAGFEYTGRETGIAELVLAWARPAGDRDSTSESGADSRGHDGESAGGYRAGLERYAARSLSPPERDFVEDALTRGPPEPVAVPGQ